MNDSLRSIATLLKDLNGILLFPHINMDGDALGSCTALCLALRSLGKDAYVMLNQPIPKNLDFLECGCCTQDADVLDRVELCIMVDCNGMNRIIGREEAWNKGKLKGCIDHHAIGVSSIQYDFFRTEPKTAATGEIIYKLIKELGVEISLDIANCIFAAITTDTGNFQHTNTTKQSHDIVGKFYDIEGFDSKAISALIYDRKSKEALYLESVILGQLQFFSDGKLAVGTVTQELLESCGCTMDETDGVIQRIMSIDGVEIGALFKENTDNIRVSLRAKNYANVGVVGAKFNGGGHNRAAGASFFSTVDAAKEELIPALEEALLK